MPSMIRIPGLDGQPMAVLGLGKSGGATAEALRASGAVVLAWDDAEAARAAVAPDLLADLTKIDWLKIQALVMSPGIPHTHPKPHPVAVAARAASCPIISDIELLYRSQPKARYVGITGTNGKSTTTTLIHHILVAADKKAAVGGNLGQAALSLEPMGADGVYVLELSSYQLEITPTAICDIAVMLNITPDHLERHGGMEGYIASKKLILAPKGKSSLGIVGIDDAPSRKLFDELKAEGKRRMLPISIAAAVEGGVHAVNGKLVDAIGPKPIDVVDLKTIPSLPGSHNWQNAAAAYAATRALGLGIDEVVAGLKSYPGLAHRQELIATINGVRFVNDSKATNADAAAKALVCYDNIYWIIGGRAKVGGLNGLEGFYPRIRHAYLIGEAAPVFARHLGNSVRWTQCATLDKAVAAANDLAQKDKLKGATVLLSPACASWDQYPNFEARGEHFRTLAIALQPAAKPAAAKPASNGKGAA